MEAARRVREVRRSGDFEGARRLSIELAATHPRDAELQYDAACVHDQLGREAEAVPFYEAALALGLTEEPLRGAYLGLGGTLAPVLAREAARRRGGEPGCGGDQLKARRGVA